MSAPIRICHVLLSLQPGGLENGVVNIVNRLDPKAFLSSVCCLQIAGAFAERIESRDVVISEMGLRPGNDLTMPLRLARLFRSLRVDVVHTRNAEAFFYGALGAILGGVRRLVHSEHGRTFPEKKHRALIQRWLLGSADFAFAVSHRLQRDLVEQLRLPPDRFEVIHNGVDVSRFQGSGSVRQSKPPSAPVIIGSVGRLVPVKNYPLLLRAAAQLPAQPPWRILLVGDGPELENLKRLAAELGISDRCELAGHCDDVPQRLSAIDIFVLPSTSEGLSNTLLEAMAAGAAVIASDVGGNGEIIKRGVSGLLFPAGELESLASMLNALVSDPELRARYAAAALERIHAEFSIDAMVSRYEAMYRRITDARRS